MQDVVLPKKLPDPVREHLSKFPWVCTGCGRCAFACPMGIDIPTLCSTYRALDRGRGRARRSRG